MDGAPSSGKRLTELDALRGLAALSVVIFHYSWEFSTQFPGASTTASGWRYGRYGVDLFFAISGFVIFMTLERTKRPSDFLVSRASRLYPAFWASILLTLVVGGAIAPELGRHSLTDVLINFTMLQDFLNVRSVDGVYWTLTVELCFYACMYGLWRAGALPEIERVLLGWIGLKLLWWLVPRMPMLAGIAMVLNFIPLFAIGILSYRVWSGARRWHQQLPVLAMAIASVVIVDRWQWPRLLCFALIIGIFHGLIHDRLGMLRVKPLLWLGGISYPLYLVHQQIGYGIMLRLEDVGIGPWSAAGFATAASLVLATLVSRIVERPALRAIRDAWARRGRVQSDPPEASESRFPTAI